MTNVTPLDFDPNRRDPERRPHLRGVPKEPPQGERYDGIGSEFAAARMHAGLDMSHVAAALRIRREHLTAIEDGRFLDLPAPAYALGFVRSYADYLGMDATAAVEAFKQETNQKRETGPLVFPTAETADRVPRGWLLGMSAFLAAVVFGAWFYSERASTVGVERVPPPPVAATSDSVVARTANNDFANIDTRRPADPVAIQTPPPPVPVVAAAAPAVAADPANPPAAAGPGIFATALNRVTGFFQSFKPAAAPATEEAPAVTAAAPTPAIAAPEPTAVTPAPEPLAALAPVAPVETVLAAPVPADAPAPLAAVTPTITAPAEPTREEIIVARPPQTQVAEAAPAATPAPARAPEAPVVAIAETPAANANTPAVPAVPTPQVAVAVTAPVVTPQPAIPPAAPQELAALPGGQNYGAVGTNARVVIIATQDSWVQITGAAGELLLTRILRAGDKYLAPNREDLVMMTGNAGAIDVTVDGRLIPALGPAGSVRRNVSLSPEKLLNGTAVAP